MNCSEAREKIPMFLAGLLDDPDELLQHIENCPACQREMEVYRAIEANLSVDMVPEHLPDKVIQRLRVLREPSVFDTWQALQWATAFLAAAALMLFLVGTNIHKILGLVNLLAGVL